jgi:hypothetical protein
MLPVTKNSQEELMRTHAKLLIATWLVILSHVVASPLDFHQATATISRHTHADIFLQGGCAANEILVAETDKAYYCLSLSDYNNSDGPKLAANYCSAKTKIAADQSAIRNLGFAISVERYLAISELAKQQQQLLKRKVMLAMFEQTLSATGALVDTAKSLNPWNVNNAVKLLEGKHFAFPVLADALRKIARVRGKPEMAAQYHQFELLAKGFVNGYVSQQAAQEDPDSAQLQLLLGALKTMQGNYELGLLVTAAEFGESLAYIYYIGGELDDLARQNDDNMGKLAFFAQRLKNDVDAAVKARKAWQEEFEIPVAPKCPS